MLDEVVTQSRLSSRLVDINQKLIDHTGSIIETHHEDWLNIYSKLVLYASVYLHETKQSFHLILNNSVDKNPIWMCESSTNNKFNALG